MEAIEAILTRLGLSWWKGRRRLRVRLVGSLIKGFDPLTREVVIGRTLAFDIESEERMEVELLGVEVQRPKPWLRRVRGKGKEEIVLLIPPRLDGPPLPRIMQTHRETWLLPEEDLRPYIRAAGLPVTYKLLPVARVRNGMKTKLVRGPDIREALVRAGA